MERLQKIQDFRQALDNLRECGATLKKNLVAFENLIDAEKFVPSNLITTVSDDFFGWIDKATTCFKFYGQLFDAALPETFSELEKMLDAEEIRIRETSVFFQAEKFLHFVTSSADLKKILSEHQKKVAKLLERKRHDAKLEAALGIYAKFVKAAKATDYVEKFSAGKELSEFFGDEFIGRGLFGGELIFTADDDAKPSRKKKSPATTETPAQSSADNKSAAEIETTSTTDAKISRKEKSLATTETPAQSTADNESAAEIETTSTTDVKISRKEKSPATVETSATAQPSADNEFAELLKTVGALLTENDLAKFDFHLDEKTPPKEFSMKRFKRDFDFKDNKLLLATLNYISRRGILWLPVFCPKDIAPDILENSAQLLFNKGYIRKYTFGNTFNFYGLAKSLIDAAKTSDGRKLLSLKNEDKRSFESRVFFANDIKRALAPMTYAYLHKIEDEQKNSSGDLDFFPQSFRAEFGKYDERDLIVGCFWDTTEECGKFLKSLLKKLRTDVKFYRVFVAGLTLEQAAKIFDALEKVSADALPKDAARYIYAFNENAFYRKDTHEKISAEDIWQTPEPDPAPEKPSAESNDDFADEKPSDESSDNFAPEKSSDESSDNFADEKSSDVEILDTTVKEKILSVVRDMILDKKFYCATAYLKAQSLQLPEVEPLYRQLAFALDDPLLHEDYGSAEIVSLSSRQDEPFNEALIIAATLRAFFYNSSNFDHGLEDMYDLVKNFELVKKTNALSNLIRNLKLFKEKTNTGVEFYAANQMDGSSSEKIFANIVRDAKDYYEQFLNGYTPEANHPVVVIMWQDIFARNGELANIFRLITNDAAKSSDNIDAVKAFLTKYFLRNDATVDVKNFDDKKFEDFVDEKWAKAYREKEGKKKGVEKFISDSKYRNNLEKTLRRAFEIMCAWINCVQTSASNNDDWSQREYKKILPQLLSDAQDVREKLKPILKTKTTAAAGIAVVVKTLEEVYWRLNGSYNKTERDYFYVEFLCGDYVITDENCLPNFNLNITDGTNENIPEQIETHARQKKFPTVAERLKSIFGKDGFGNYGAAKVLDSYLQASEGWSFIEKNVFDLKTSIKAAGHEIQEQCTDFSGGVVFAQIQGQLETLPEGTKDKILQVIDSCYAYAEKSRNYGVFFRVKKFWEDAINQNADKLVKKFLDELQQVVDDFTPTTADFEPDELQTSVEDIKKFIALKMFTKAEACINILRSGKVYKKSVLDGKDILSKFFEDYEELYQRVKDTSIPLEKVLEKWTDSHKNRNKDMKNRADLIKNWLPNGIPSSEERIMERVKNLLELLAFDVENISFLEKDSDTIIYKVKLKKFFKISHTHPIADFGSDAESDEGFHVACLFGKYDEQSLLNHFKKLDSGDTIILLDYPLKPQVRRKLDKVLKRDKSLMHVFAVIDRVVIMYLIKNCYEQIKKKDINDTLMSLIMPFSKCVPYISNPKNDLPPEMFIGRENEMRKVKDPHGVNIVYGGRQLGKSALLKMARREIDGNNNQRAIFVEIKNENYREAALHVSHELSDKKFFDSPIETDDWEELTRAIRNRLMSDEPYRIKYFLLMLDEADKFVESCAPIYYKPIDSLAQIQQENYNGSCFKFVIAGVHNIVRYNNEQKQKDNNVLPVFKPPQKITPFSPEEARRLLEVPLGYLGVHFADDKFISMIEETALYFPGLIQYFCEKLLTMLFDLKNYDEDTPPYVISEKHIKKLLADEDFLNVVKERINITLKIEDDKYYYVIAQLLAYLYHTKNPLTAFSPRDILTCAEEEFGVSFTEKFLPNDESKIDALMLELCELNILRKNPDSAKYSFSSRSIRKYMGTDEEIFEKLYDLMEKPEHA